MAAEGERSRKAGAAVAVGALLLGGGVLGAAGHGPAGSAHSAASPTDPSSGPRGSSSRRAPRGAAAGHSAAP
jgi:hypothetical protein